MINFLLRFKLFSISFVDSSYFLNLVAFQESVSNSVNIFNNEEQDSHFWVQQSVTIFHAFDKRFSEFIITLEELDVVCGNLSELLYQE